MPTTTPEQDRKAAADMLALLAALKDWAQGTKVLTITKHMGYDVNGCKISEVTDYALITSL